MDLISLSLNHVIREMTPKDSRFRHSLSDAELNLSWGKKKVAVVERWPLQRFKQEPMYGMSAKKVPIVERWPLDRLYYQTIQLQLN